MTGAASPTGAPIVTNPVEKAGDTVIDSTDQIATGVIGGVTKMGHGFSRGVGALLMAPFKTKEEADKEYGTS